MKRFLKVALMPVTLAILIVLGWWLLKDTAIDVLQPQGRIAQQQRSLLYFTVALSAIVVIPVFTMLGIFAWKYRQSRNPKNYSPEWSENTKLELLWWGIPIIIIGILSVVTWQTSHSLDPHKPIESHKPTIEVQVIALQWKWLFLYPKEGIATVNELPIPVDTPVHFTIAADAPMSAFWVPSLGTQVYSMNGMSTQLNLIANSTGEYKGYNTNINGQGYAAMTFTVKALDQTNYERWRHNARENKDIMDMTSYEKLAQPGIEKGQKEYRLTDAGLYDKVIAKYMSGHSSSDSSHHTMEGM